MDTRPIEIDHREAGVVELEGEVRRDGEVVNGVGHEVQHICIPGGKDPARSSIGGFENERAERGGRNEEAKKGERSPSFVSCKQMIEGESISRTARTWSRLRRSPSPRTF